MVRGRAAFVLSLFVLGCLAREFDSVGDAITVYRNPDFFGHVDIPQRIPEIDDDYKYPGETKKPNPRPPNSFVGTFDDSPEFGHNPRDVFHDPGFTPNRGRGPFGHPRHSFPPIGFSRLGDDDDELEEPARIEDENLEEDDANLEEAEEDREEDPAQIYEEEAFSRMQLQPFERDREEYDPEVVDKKKGTREYYRDHRGEMQPAGEVLDLTLRHSPLLSRPLGSNPAPRAPSKVVVRSLRPVFLLKLKTRPRRQKFAVKFRPFFLPRFRRSNRAVADDSVYQLNSELDMDYENALRSRPFSTRN